MKHIQGAPLRPQTQGIVEAVMKKLNFYMCKEEMAHFPDTWDTRLPYCQIAINNAPRTALGGLSAAEFVFGQTQRSLADVLTELDITAENNEAAEQDQQTLLDACFLRLEKLAKDRRKAKVTDLKQAQERTKVHNKAIKKTWDFSPGSKVKCDLDSKETRLGHTTIGTIVEEVRPGTFKVEKESGGSRRS